MRRGGLGNPGERYRRTRHNVGFMVVDALAAARRRRRGREEARRLGGRGARSAGQDVLLVKPLTFMNRSGLAVERLLAAHGRRPADLVVVVDDVALELGRLRVRERGSHGGHNGLRSIIDVAGHRRVPAGAGGHPEGRAAGRTSRTTCCRSSRRRTCWSCRRWWARRRTRWSALSREGVPAAMNRFNGQAAEPSLNGLDIGRRTET